MGLGGLRSRNGRASATRAAEEDAHAADSDSDVESISSAEFRNAVLGDSGIESKAQEGGGFPELGEDDDVIVTCCIGQIACKDLPHQRPDCAENLFIMGQSDLNCKHCPKCFCYVCDVKASECQFWGTGLHESDHANARAVPPWVRLRRMAHERKMELVRAAAATGGAGCSGAPTRSGLRARSRSTSRSRSRSRQAITKNTPSRASSRSTVSLAAAARPRTRRATAAAAAAEETAAAAAAGAAAAGNAAARRNAARAAAGAEAEATRATRRNQRVKAKRVRVAACRAAPRTPVAAGPSEAQTPSRRAAAAETSPGLAEPQVAMEVSAAGQGAGVGVNEGGSPMADNARPAAAGPEDMEVDGAESDADTVGDSIADEAGAGAADLGGMDIDEGEGPQGNAEGPTAAAAAEVIAQTDTVGAPTAAQEGLEPGNAARPLGPRAPPSPALLTPGGVAEGLPAAAQPRPSSGSGRSPLRPLRPNPAASSGLPNHAAGPGPTTAAVAETPGVKAPLVRTAGRPDAEWEARGSQGRRPKLDRPVIAAAAAAAAAGDGPAGDNGRKRQREKRTGEHFDGENGQDTEGQAQEEGLEQERGRDEKKARRGSPPPWAPEGVGPFNIGWQPAAEGGARWRRRAVVGAIQAVGAVVGAACLFLISNVPQ